jgi:hypothetical protein
LVPKKISWAVAVPLMTLLEPQVQNPIRIAYADISVEDHTSQRVGRQGFAVGGVLPSRSLLLPKIMNSTPFYGDGAGGRDERERTEGY